MSTEVAIRVENLSKRYVLGKNQGSSGMRYKTLRESLTQSAASALRRLRRLERAAHSPDATEFWALRDVSFEIKRGEVVGIVGRNGAGKSTLLKILSRITEPTEGRISIKGRVASLLEVGTGFHPELTGRENIYLNGAILGMSRVEIKAKFDEIVAFAEVEKFLDTPVKRYSSGMYVRLAFAVAAHLEPEILIIDEVLAVGDAEFQKKCLGKMSEVAGGGRTVIFVSHNMGAVAQLCREAILLEKGRLSMQGNTATVVNRYLSAASEHASASSVRDATQHSGPMWISQVEAINAAGQATAQFGHNEKITLVITYRVRQPAARALTGFAVRDERGRKIFISEVAAPQSAGPDGGAVLRAAIPAGILVPGRYFFTFHIHVPGVAPIDFAEDFLQLTLTDVGHQFSHYGELDYGCVFVNCAWEFEHSATSLPSAQPLSAINA